MKIGADVLEAKATVALETTLVAHGFPPGEGVEVGLAAEQAVRDAGAVPATIGVLNGEIRVGLTRGRSDLAISPPRPRRASSARRRSAAHWPCASTRTSSSWRRAG